MSAKKNVFKCKHCGLVVEVLTAGADPVCCGEPMELLPEKTADAKTEKHVPVIEKIDGGYKVVVGSIPHPMLENHWIEWIELVVDGKSYRQFLKPGDAPEAVFAIDACACSVGAREYCNVHGLWKA